VVAVEDWYRVRAAFDGEPGFAWEPLLIDKPTDGRLLQTGYFGEVEEFVNATAEGRPTTAASIDDGVACLELVAAVRQSIAMGGRVSLADIRSVDAVR
jgi:predicted dehydrogenase